MLQKKAMRQYAAFSMSAFAYLFRVCRAEPSVLAGTRAMLGLRRRRAARRHRSGLDEFSRPRQYAHGVTLHGSTLLLQLQMTRWRSTFFQHHAERHRVPRWLARSLRVRAATSTPSGACASPRPSTLSLFFFVSRLVPPSMTTSMLTKLNESAAGERAASDARRALQRGRRRGERESGSARAFPHAVLALPCAHAPCPCPCVLYVCRGTARYSRIACRQCF